MPEEVEYGVMNATLFNRRSGPNRIVAACLIPLIHSGHIIHCVFPTATGFALGPRLLAEHADGADVLVLEGDLEQEWGWGDMPQMAAALKG